MTKQKVNLLIEIHEINPEIDMLVNKIIGFLLRRTGHRDHLENGFWKKWQNTSACLSKHRQTNSGYPNRGSAGSVQRNNGYIQGQAVRTTGHDRKYINRYTFIYSSHTPQLHHQKEDTTARIYVQTRGRNEEQPKTKHHWQTPFFCRPSPLKDTTPVKTSTYVLDTWDVPFRKSGPSSLPDMRFCTDNLLPVEELWPLNVDGWSMVKGQTLGEAAEPCGNEWVEHGTLSWSDMGM